MNFKNFFRELGLIFSTTVGAGIFALPYIFKEAGWALSILYLLVFSGLMVSVHIIYWKVLVKTGKAKRLLALVRDYFGELGFKGGLVAIVGGLALAMVAYLVLGGQFLRLIFPGLSNNAAVLIFWIFASIPFFFKLNRMIGLEVWGGLFLALTAFFLFFDVWPITSSIQIPVFNSSNLFFPFGAVLFALAGWTAIEPIYDSSKRRAEGTSSKIRAWQFGFAAFGASLIYSIFVLAILGSADRITPDTVSGLLNWASFKLLILAAFGIFAIWTSYLPFGRELESLAMKDLKLSRPFSLTLVLVLPIVFVFLGLKNFLEITGLVGGVFLATQYFFIVLVGAKVLKARSFLGRLGLFLAGAIFFLGAVYEIYYFVIR